VLVVHLPDQVEVVFFVHLLSHIELTHLSYFLMS
jgi:hypothetical protein